ncbi:hypothetical protein PAXRUDRAFT_17614 [Paxillus rubicundulus Ve08.2h10]|uniref:Uncharacterized protein n=1 Tax=Paxillus rubicundulus Ve08.2h10 TaxID=930991 RepID=A0A0D0C282_9AGAM|nr:hypothetical protein PAXRUDRAFT_17614 [Paxillus rubicundulus Ve08.2h10]
MANPALEVHPIFASEDFTPIHEALIQTTNKSAQQVTESDQAQAAEEAEQQWREKEKEELCLAKEEAKWEHREEEKKKPKMNNFDQTTSISSIIIPCPSQHVLQKLNSFDHINLWYFSLAGCTEASKYNRYNADKTFGISKVDNILMLHMVASVKASRNALEDHDRSFKAFLQAKKQFSFLHDEGIMAGQASVCPGGISLEH